ncbi:hypothetical protein A4G19_04340 [Pasteurellaceae bacterium Macca]|nr:hypothetical protein [Pasteurellaceae bacterium Macca]
MQSLYPIAQLNIAESDFTIQAFWQQHLDKLPQDQPYYGIYLYDNSQKLTQFVIATEQSNNLPVIKTDPFVWYETFLTTKAFVDQTWERIKNKEKQGLLRRAYSLDIEKYNPDGKVEIHISLVAHC